MHSLTYASLLLLCLNTSCALQHSLPDPTPAPHPALVRAALAKRQLPATADDTCGYFNGIQSSSLTCATGYCGYNSDVSAFGCCNSVTVGANGAQSLTDCVFQTACYDSTRIGLCDEFCQLNTAQLLCTSSEAPVCFEYTIPENGYSGFGCGPSYTLLTVDTSYGAMEAGPSASSSPIDISASSEVPGGGSSIMPAMSASPSAALATSGISMSPTPSARSGSFSTFSAGGGVAAGQNGPSSMASASGSGGAQGNIAPLRRPDLLLACITGCLVFGASQFILF